ncbi:unnamed protein product [Amoebophrya sp. A120]|nr:unnamed protein product [Amoebophrya sp. A120]|eukprot:GSA120T00019576001.1
MYSSASTTSSSSSSYTSATNKNETTKTRTMRVFEDNLDIKEPAARLANYVEVKDLQEESVFLKMEVKVKYGKCQLWPEKMLIQADREIAQVDTPWEDERGCFTDGRPESINSVLQHMRYISPKNFFGQDEIELKIYRDPDFYLPGRDFSILEEPLNTEILNPTGNQVEQVRQQYIEQNAKRLKIPVEVVPVNDAPRLSSDRTFYSVLEDGLPFPVEQIYLEDVDSREEITLFVYLDDGGVFEQRILVCGPELDLNATSGTGFEGGNDTNDTAGSSSSRRLSYHSSSSSGSSSAMSSSGSSSSAGSSSTSSSGGGGGSSSSSSGYVSASSGYSYEYMAENKVKGFLQMNAEERNVDAVLKHLAPVKNGVEHLYPNVSVQLFDPFGYHYDSDSSAGQNILNGNDTGLLLNVSYRVNSVLYPNKYSACFESFYGLALTGSVQDIHKIVNQDKNLRIRTQIDYADAFLVKYFAVDNLKDAKPVETLTPGTNSYGQAVMSYSQADSSKDPKMSNEITAHVIVQEVPDAPKLSNVCEFDALEEYAFREVQKPEYNDLFPANSAPHNRTLTQINVVRDLFVRNVTFAYREQVDNGVVAAPSPEEVSNNSSAVSASSTSFTNALLIRNTMQRVSVANAHPHPFLADSASASLESTQGVLYVEKIRNRYYVHNATLSSEPFLGLVRRGGCTQIRHCVILEPSNEWESYDSTVVAYLKVKDDYWSKFLEQTLNCTLFTSALQNDTTSLKLLQAQTAADVVLPEECKNSNATGSGTSSTNSTGSATAGIIDDDDSSNSTAVVDPGISTIPNPERLFQFMHGWSLSVEDANVELRGEKTDRLYVIGELASVSKALKGGIYLESARTIWDDKGALKTLDFFVDIEVKSLGRLFDPDSDPVKLFHEETDIESMSEDRERWYYPSEMTEIFGDIYSGDAFYQEYHGPVLLGMTPTWTIHDPAFVTPYQKLSTGAGATEDEDDLAILVPQSSGGGTTSNLTNGTNGTNSSSTSTSTGVNNSSATTENNDTNSTNASFSFPVPPPRFYDQTLNRFPSVQRSLKVQFRRINTPPIIETSGESVFFETTNLDEFTIPKSAQIQIKDPDVGAPKDLQQLLAEDSINFVPSVISQATVFQPAKAALVPKHVYDVHVRIESPILQNVSFANEFFPVESEGTKEFVVSAAEANKNLQDTLKVYFPSQYWYGTAPITLKVSDLGNAGYDAFPPLPPEHTAFEFYSVQGCVHVDAVDNSGGELAVLREGVEDSDASATNSTTSADSSSLNNQTAYEKVSIAKIPPSAEHSSRWWDSLFSKSYTIEFYVKYDGTEKVLFSTNRDLPLLEAQKDYDPFANYSSDAVSNETTALTPGSKQEVDIENPKDFSTFAYDLDFADTPGGINLYAENPDVPSCPVVEDFPLIDLQNLTVTTSQYSEKNASSFAIDSDYSTCSATDDSGFAAGSHWWRIRFTNQQIRLRRYRVYLPSGSRFMTTEEKENILLTVDVAGTGQTHHALPKGKLLTDEATGSEFVEGEVDIAVKELRVWNSAANGNKMIGICELQLFGDSSKYTPQVFARVDAQSDAFAFNGDAFAVVNDSNSSSIANTQTGTYGTGMLMRSRYRNKGHLAGIRVAMDATNYYDFFLPKDKQHLSLEELIGTSEEEVERMVLNDQNVVSTDTLHSATYADSITTCQNVANLAKVEAALASENGIYDVPSSSAGDSRVANLVGPDSGLVRNSTMTGFGFPFAGEGTDDSDTRERSRCSNVGKLLFNLKVSSEHGGFLLGNSSLPLSVERYNRENAMILARLGVLHDFSSSCCTQPMNVIGVGVESSPSANMPDDSTGPSGAGNSGVLESFQIEPLSGGVNSSFSSSGSAGAASTTTPFKFRQLQGFMLYRLTYQTTTTSTTTRRPLPSYCLKGATTSTTAGASSTTPKTPDEIRHSRGSSDSTVGKFREYQFDSDATLQVDKSGRLFYQIARSNLPIQYWARSGLTATNTLEVGRWSHIALVHTRNEGQPWQKNTAAIFVDGNEIVRFPLWNIYSPLDKKATGLHFCGYRFTQMKVWTQATPKGDLGVCTNRHKTLSVTQNADYRYRNLKLDLSLEDRFYYNQDLMNDDKFSLAIAGRWRADGPSRCRYDRSMLTYCLCYHGTLSNSILKQHSNANVDREKFPDVDVVSDITRKYYYRSRQALKSPGEDANSADHVLPEMSVRISHAAVQKAEQELSVFRPYSAVDTKPTLIMRGAGRNELDWKFHKTNITTVATTSSQNTTLSPSENTDLEIATGYQVGEDGAMTVDLHIEDFERWDMSYFSHRVEVAVTCDHCFLRSLSQTSGLRMEVRDDTAANSTTKPFDELSAKLALDPTTPPLLENQMRKKFFYVAAPLKYLNEFLSRLEYKPDRNFFGVDPVLVQAKDPTGKLSNRIDILIDVQPVPDIPALICPPSLELDENDFDDNPGFDKLFLRDNDVPEGESDDNVVYSFTAQVSEGFIRYNSSLAFPEILSTGGASSAVETMRVANDSVVVEQNKLTTINRLADIRQILKGMTYEASSSTFHGVVLATFNAQNVAPNSLAMECSAGLLVHPVNTAPTVSYTGPLTVSRKTKLGLGISIAGLRFDDVDFTSDRFSDRLGAVRVDLSVGGFPAACSPTLSLADDNFDRILGIPTENIGSTEGLSFLVGNGWNDAVLSMEGSLPYMNRQVGRRLLLDAGAANGNGNSNDLYNQQSTIPCTTAFLNVTVNDKGNFGKGAPLEASLSLLFTIVA